MQNKQKPIKNSYRRNLRSTPVLMLLSIEFKTLRKKPGDEEFQVLFKFQGRGLDQKLANLNRFSDVETRSCCYISMVLQNSIK